MIVIADTSPINYLVLIDAVGVLPALYQTVVIPQAVFDELQVPETPERVRAWITHPPDWFKVERGMVLPDLDFRDLDKGEIEAIALATHLEADAIIIDDRAGRDEAKKRGIFVIGTLAVLASAAEIGLPDLPDTLQKASTDKFSRVGQFNFRVA